MGLLIIYIILIALSITCYILLEKSITVQCSTLLTVLCSIGFIGSLVLMGILLGIERWIAIENLLK